MRHLLFLLLAVALPSVAQQVDPSATRAIDQVLQGARVLELPDGKKLVEQNSWTGLSVPIFDEAKTLLEVTFDTDSTGIQGVKRLIELSGSGDSDGLLTDVGRKLRDIDEQYGRSVEPLRPVSQRFVAIAYRDAETKRWKVMSITSRTDTAAEVAERQDFDKPDRSSLLGSKPSLKRYWFAIALIQDGKLRRARQELEACLQMSLKERAAEGDKASVNNVTMRINELDAITGNVENIEAGATLPAAAAQLAQEWYLKTTQEQAQSIQNGQASITAVVTSPVGAEVYIDGNKGGVTPFSFVLIKRDAPRTVTIKLAGYKTVEKTLVPDGKPIPIAVTLEKETK